MKLHGWLVATAFITAGLAAFLSMFRGDETYTPAARSTPPRAAPSPVPRDAAPTAPHAPTRADILSAVESLAAASAAGDPAAIEPARARLRGFGTPAIPVIGAFLGAERPAAVRLEFLQFLRAYRERAAFEVVAALAAKLAPAAPGAELRRATAQALAVTGGHGALEMLLTCLRDPAWTSAQADLIQGIVAVAYPADQDRLADALSASDLAAARNEILAALARRARDLKRDPSTALLEDPDPELNRAAIFERERRAMAGDPQALESLLAALRAPNPPAAQSRENLLAALLRLRSEATRRALVDRGLEEWLAANPTEDCRIALADALARFGLREDRPLLVKLSRPAAPRIEQALNFFDSRLASAEKASHD